MSFFIKDILGETSSDRTTSNNTSRDLPSSETTAFTNFTKTDSDSEERAERSQATLEHDTELDQFGKKRRILFTRQQTWQLERAFRFQPYLSSPERDLLARRIHLSPNQIKIWFQNHRYKLKKYVKDIIQQAEFEHDRHSMAQYRKYPASNNENCPLCFSSESQHLVSYHGRHSNSIEHAAAARQNQRFRACPCQDRLHQNASRYLIPPNRCSCSAHHQ